jgi:hypothetical protein
MRLGRFVLKGRAYDVSDMDTSDILLNRKWFIHEAINNHKTSRSVRPAANVMGQ